MDSDEEIIADDLSDILSDDECNISDSEDSNSSSDESIIGKKCKKFSRPIISSSDSDSNTSDNDEDENREEWSEQDDTPFIEHFLGSAHVTVAVNNPENLNEVRLFIGEDLFELLQVETNRYHEQNENKFKRQKNTRKWENVTNAEIKKMLELILLMGKVRKDTRDEYWSTDSTIETPIFSKVMSRNRFRQISSALHFANNTNITNNSDRLFKILPIINYFVPKFINIYKPQQ